MSATHSFPTNNAQVLSRLRYSEIGGGEGYQSPQRIRQRDADVTVRTKAQFLTEVNRSGRRTIWIPGDVSINLTGETFSMTDKVVASDRGQGNSDGALLYNNTRGINSTAMNGGISGGLWHLRGRSRVTGLRFRGAAHNYWSNSEHPGYIPYPDGDAAARRAVYNANHARGLKVHSSNVEIDNSELYGWASAAIHIGDSSRGYDPEIHHCHLHDNMMTSAGYCVDIVKGRPHVHHCHFNAFRHAIDGFGFPDCSFVVEDNVFGHSQSSHAVDMHGLHNNFSSARTNGTRSSEWFHGNAGGRMIVRRNTFLATHVIPDATFDRGRRSWAISIRGVPWPRSGQGILIERNHFPHANINRNGAGSGIRDFNHGGAYNQQVSGSGWSYPTGADRFTANYVHRDNRYTVRTTSHRSGYGAPIDLRNPPTSVVATVEDDDDDPPRGISQERGRSMLEAMQEQRAAQAAETEVNT